MSYILAIDTSCSICSAVVLANGKVIAEQNHPEPNMQAEMLPSLSNQTLLDSGIQLGDIDKIVVTVGPGSFTGIRIGVAYAHGLHLVLKKTNLNCELIGITTMQSMAYQAQNEGEYVIMLDAGRKSVYMQRFVMLEPQNDIALVAEDEIANYADNLPIYGNANRLSDFTISSLQKTISPSAASAGMYYIKSHQAFIYEPIPIYVREPDATKSWVPN